MNDTTDPPRRVGRRQVGFVLVYTLWIVAAASIALALFARSASRPARVGERQFKAAIELPETVNVLDYVLAHTISQEREIDARFITYGEQTQSASAQAGRGLVRELKEILGQIGMELDIPDDPETGLNVVTEEKETREPAGGDTIKVRQGRVFGGSQEERTLRLGKSSYLVRVQPGNAKPNLNLLGRSQLARYLVHLGLAEDAARRLSAVVHDWADADDFLSDDGAESAQYPFASGPRNGPIRSWDEVFYLKGASAQLVEFLRENFTLHGESPVVNAAFLSPEALAAISDLELWEVKVALENHDLPKEEQLALGTLIGKQEAQRFQASVGWDPDSRILLVEVRGEHMKASAVFDTADQQLLDWYLWR